MKKFPLNKLSFLFNKRISTFGFAVMFGMSGTLAISALAASFYPVEIIEIDSNAEKVAAIRTNIKDPDEIVTLAGIQVGKEDVVDTTGFKTGKESDITIYRSCSVSVDLGDKLVEIPTAVTTVAYTLEQNEIELDEDDELNIPEDELVYEGMEIEVYRAFEVSVTDGDETKIVEIATGTVADAIEKAGIELDSDDEAEPSLDTEIYEGIEIQVLRTEYVSSSETREIKFGKKTVRDDKLAYGISEVTREGKNGESLITKTDKYVNGKLVDTSTEEETVLPAVDQVTTIGTFLESITLKDGTKTVSSLTLPKSLEIDENGVPKNYSSYFDGKATAYHCGTHTATGKEVRTGYVAVNPKVIPYGTEMWIVSLDGNYVYGYAVAEDTGGFVHNGSGVDVDLYFDSEAACYDFGVRGVRIYFI